MPVRSINKIFQALGAMGRKAHLSTAANTQAQASKALGITNQLKALELIQTLPPSDLNNLIQGIQRTPKFQTPPKSLLTQLPNPTQQKILTQFSTPQQFLDSLTKANKIKQGIKLNPKKPNITNLTRAKRIKQLQARQAKLNQQLLSQGHKNLQGLGGKKTNPGDLLRTLEPTRATPKPTKAPTPEIPATTQALQAKTYKELLAIKNPSEASPTPFNSKLETLNSKLERSTSEASKILDTTKLQRLLQENTDTTTQFWKGAPQQEITNITTFRQAIPPKALLENQAIWQTILASGALKEADQIAQLGKQGKAHKYAEKIWANKTINQIQSHPILGPLSAPILAPFMAGATLIGGAPLLLSDVLTKGPKALPALGKTAQTQTTPGPGGTKITRPVTIGNIEAPPQQTLTPQKPQTPDLPKQLTSLKETLTKLSTPTPTQNLDDLRAQQLQQLNTLTGEELKAITKQLTPHLTEPEQRTLNALTKARRTQLITLLEDAKAEQLDIANRFGINPDQNFTPQFIDTLNTKLKQHLTLKDLENFELTKDNIPEALNKLHTELETKLKAEQQALKELNFEQHQKLKTEKRALMQDYHDAQILYIENIKAQGKQTKPSQRITLSEAQKTNPQAQRLQTEIEDYYLLREIIKTKENLGQENFLAYKIWAVQIDAELDMLRTGKISDGTQTKMRIDQLDTNIGKSSEIFPSVRILDNLLFDRKGIQIALAHQGKELHEHIQKMGDLLGIKTKLQTELNEIFGGRPAYETDQKIAELADTDILTTEGEFIGFLFREALDKNPQARQLLEKTVRDSNLSIDEIHTYLDDNYIGSSGLNKTDPEAQIELTKKLKEIETRAKEHSAIRQKLNMLDENGDVKPEHFTTPEETKQDLYLQSTSRSYSDQTRQAIYDELAWNDHTATNPTTTDSKPLTDLKLDRTQLTEKEIDLEKLYGQENIKGLSEDQKKYLHYRAQTQKLYTIATQDLTPASSSYDEAIETYSKQTGLTPQQTQSLLERRHSMIQSEAAAKMKLGGNAVKDVQTDEIKVASQGAMKRNQHDQNLEKVAHFLALQNKIADIKNLQQNPQSISAAWADIFKYAQDNGILINGASGTPGSKAAILSNIYGAELNLNKLLEGEIRLAARHFGTNSIETINKIFAAKGLPSLTPDQITTIKSQINHDALATFKHYQRKDIQSDIDFIIANKPKDQNKMAIFLTEGQDTKQTAQKIHATTKQPTYLTDSEGTHFEITGEGTLAKIEYETAQQRYKDSGGYWIHERHNITGYSNKAFQETSIHFDNLDDPLTATDASQDSARTYRGIDYDKQGQRIFALYSKEAKAPDNLGQEYLTKGANKQADTMRHGLNQGIESLQKQIGGLQLIKDIKLHSPTDIYNKLSDLASDLLYEANAYQDTLQSGAKKIPKHRTSLPTTNSQPTHLLVRLRHQTRRHKTRPTQKTPQTRQTPTSPNQKTTKLSQNKIHGTTRTTPR